MKVLKDHIITINYEIKDTSGTVVDTSEGEEPLEYLHGHGLMLPGIEKNLEGGEEGKSISLWLEPEDGFGLRDSEKIVELDRSLFEEDADLESGIEFDIQDEEGEGIITILSVDGNKVMADRNHPLAGKRLHVEAEIIHIKKAEDWEIEGWKHHTH